MSVAQDALMSNQDNQDNQDFTQEDIMNMINEVDNPDNKAKLAATSRADFTTLIKWCTNEQSINEKENFISYLVHVYNIFCTQCESVEAITWRFGGYFTDDEEQEYSKTLLIEQPPPQPIQVNQANPMDAEMKQVDDEFDMYWKLKHVKPIKPSITILTMQDKIDQMQNMYNRIYMALQAQDVITTPTPCGIKLLNMLNAIGYRIKQISDMFIAGTLAVFNQDTAIIKYMNDLSPLTIYKDIGKPDKGGSISMFLTFMCTKLFELGLKRVQIRDDGRSNVKAAWFYKPMRDRLTGQYIHTYEYYGNTHDVIQRAIKGNTLYHTMYLEKGFKGLTADKQLQVDEKVPNLRENRYWFSFKNGVYDIEHCRFYFYNVEDAQRMSKWYTKFNIPDKGYHVDQLPTNHPLGDVACKYHDMLFPFYDMEKEYYIDPKTNTYTKKIHLLNIKCDPVYIMLRAQGYGGREPTYGGQRKAGMSDAEFAEKELELVFIIGLLGRLLYQLEQFEKWGIGLYFLGVAGTGKSTLLKWISLLYHLDRVGFINNTIEQGFGIHRLLDKWVCLALDVDDKFRLSQMDLQSMLVGEYVSANVKYGTASTQLWKSAIAMAANVILPFTDNGGSMRRRLFVVDFGYKIRIDPTLWDKCLLNTPRFLYLITRAYQYLYTKHGHENIKEVAPNVFKQADMNHLSSMNLTTAFITDYCDSMTIDVDKLPNAPIYYCQATEFTTYLQEYINRNTSPDKRKAASAQTQTSSIKSAIVNNGGRWIDAKDKDDTRIRTKAKIIEHIQKYPLDPNQPPFKGDNNFIIGIKFTESCKEQLRRQ